MELNIEINAAEGGEDAVQLIDIQAQLLSKYITSAGGTVRTVARTKG